MNYNFDKNKNIETTIDLSYLRPLKRKKVISKLDAFCYREKLTASAYDDALVLPGTSRRKGCVLDNKGNMVKSSTTLWFGGAYELEKGQQVDYDSRTVVFLGEYATRTWGHI